MSTDISDEEVVRLITDEVLRLFESGASSAPLPAGGVAHAAGPIGAGFLSSGLVPDGIPIGVSVRHIHLSGDDCDALFGKGHELRRRRELYQRNQYACEETLTVVGPKGCLTGLRVLAPLRRKTQVEVARTDAIQLGVIPDIVVSVHDGRGAPCALAGPQGAIVLEDALVRMKRHIHLSPEEATSLGLKDRDEVDVRIPGAQGLIFCNTVIRTHPDFRAEMHIDTDEGNAAGICCGQRGYIVNEQGDARGRCTLCAF